MEEEEEEEEEEEKEESHHHQHHQHQHHHESIGRLGRHTQVCVAFESELCYSGSWTAAGLSNARLAR